MRQASGPLRGMYVGQSERNQEKAFAAIRALAPVVVIVDESDQAEGGSRDQGSGDSGVTERMRAGAFNFWADNALRGKVLRIDSTNRVDLIDSAMRRSGRTDIKIPILMPDEVGAPPDLRGAWSRSTGWPRRSPTTRPSRERTDGYTGSDIELAVTTAYRFALRDGATGITDAHLTAALDDLLPDVPRPGRHRPHDASSPSTRCRNKRLLPRNHEQIRREIEARRQARA